MGAYVKHEGSSLARIWIGDQRAIAIAERIMAMIDARWPAKAQL